MVYPTSAFVPFNWEVFVVGVYRRFLREKCAARLAVLLMHVKGGSGVPTGPPVIRPVTFFRRYERARFIAGAGIAQIQVEGGDNANVVRSGQGRI